MQKSVTWNLHLDDSQVTHRYYMILGYYLLSELNIDLCVYNNTTIVNGGTYT